MPFMRRTINTRLHYSCTIIRSFCTPLISNTGNAFWVFWFKKIIILCKCMGFNKFYIAEALKWIKEINDENGDYSRD